MSYTIKEVNLDTGEIVERDMTAEEIKTFNDERAILTAQQNETQALLEKKATAIAKLAALGLTADDITALGL